MSCVCVANVRVSIHQNERRKKKDETLIHFHIKYELRHTITNHSIRHMTWVKRFCRFVNVVRVQSTGWSRDFTHNKQTNKSKQFRTIVIAIVFLKCWPFLSRLHLFMVWKTHCPRNNILHLIDVIEWQKGEMCIQLFLDSINHCQTKKHSTKINSKSC